ncbi:unnamed protein product, partial [Hapterophycus canaliculatus]
EREQIRLAREAFDTPVHSSAAHPVSGQQQQDPIGAGGGGSGAPRGRAASPALSVDLGGARPHRDHDSSRSPMHTRSTPSTPGLEDRRHRRTRRGGRRGRNRSPRPGDQPSPRLGDGDNHNDGYSSASYSPRPRRSMSDPWADPHDQYPRSSSQPRTVSRDDHPLLSALSRDGSVDGYGGGGSDGGARLIHPGDTGGAATAADSEDLSGAGVARDDGVSGAGSGSTEAGAAAAAAAVAGGRLKGDKWPAQAAHPPLLSSQAAAFSSRSLHNGSGGRLSPPMSDTAWKQELHDRRRADGTAPVLGGGIERGPVDGAGVAEDFQHYHGGSSRGRDREREMRPERGTGALLFSGQRPRSLHHLDRRQFAEGERRQFPAEAEQVHTQNCAGGMPHVHGMIGNERLTSLRGFEDPRTGPLHQPQHDQGHHSHHHHHQQQQQTSSYFLRTQRSNSEGILRPSSQQQQHHHHHRQQQHHSYLRAGSSTGNMSNNKLPLRAQQDAPRMGDRHHYPQQQQHLQQLHPHRRYGSESTHQHPPQGHQHHHAGGHGGYPGAGVVAGVVAGAGGSWAASGGSARYLP